MSRIYLSPPHMGADERALLMAAFDSNWIAPLGPEVDAFERECPEDRRLARVALSSGTAAIHLALRSGVREGDEVIVSTFTRCVCEPGRIAAPNRSSSTATVRLELDPICLEEPSLRATWQTPESCHRRRPYGQTADYDPILDAPAVDIPVIEDCRGARRNCW